MTPETWIRTALLCAASYLAGAIPFGLLIGKARGVDVRTVGSGNIGATNVFRTVGKTWGILTFICDLLKGFAAAALFPLLLRSADIPPLLAQGLPLLGGICAIAGHNWPVYLGFKGGKGVATSAGVLLGVAPAAMGIGLAAWAVVFLLSRYVSIASMLAAATVAASAWALYPGRPFLLPGALTLLALLAIVRHHGNIRRLAAGTEHRFEFGRKKPQTQAPDKPTPP